MSSMALCCSTSRHSLVLRVNDASLQSFLAWSFGDPTQAGGINAENARLSVDPRPLPSSSTTLRPKRHVPSFHQLITTLPDRESPVIATTPQLDVAPLRGIGHLSSSLVLSSMHLNVDVPAFLPLPSMASSILRACEGLLL